MPPPPQPPPAPEPVHPPLPPQSHHHLMQHQMGLMAGQGMGGNPYLAANPGMHDAPRFPGHMMGGGGGGGGYGQGLSDGGADLDPPPRAQRQGSRKGRRTREEVAIIRQRAYEEKQKKKEEEDAQLAALVEEVGLSDNGTFIHADGDMHAFLCSYLGVDSGGHPDSHAVRERGFCSFILV